MEMKCLEGTRLGLREQLPAEQPMAWHARGREGWLAPARVTMSNKNGGGKPLPDHEHATGFWSMMKHASKVIAIQLNRRFRLSYVSFQAR
jgi:hypothetical protein